MKIGVYIEFVPGGEIDSVLKNGKISTYSNYEYVINPYSLYALEKALCIKDQLPDTEVLIFFCGNDNYTDELYSVIAMGCDMVIHLERYKDNLFNSYNEALSLSEVPEIKSCDLLLFGSDNQLSSSEPIAYNLAALLDIKVTGIIKRLDFDIDESQIITHEKDDDGFYFKHKYNIPLIGIYNERNEPRYPSVMQIIKSKRIAIKKVSNIEQENFEHEFIQHDKKFIKREGHLFESTEKDVFIDRLILDIKAVSKVN